MQDRRCRFGLAARIEMIGRRRAGESFRVIATALACSPSTVKTQWDRWQAASAAERADFSCLAPRRPIPRSCPWALSAQTQAQILDARAKTGWGEMRLPVLCGGRHRSSIGKVLRRHGVYDRPKVPRPASRSYEWTQAGALLHIDALKLAKFDKPGHWATGDRSDRTRAVSGTLGETVVIGVIDDHTRLVYAELHAAENAQTVADTLARAIPWFTEQGCGRVQAVMSDNAFAYTKSNAFAALKAHHGFRHITPPPYTPRWNGKIERWFQTAKREWSHGRVWQTSRQRDRALSSFLRFYNRQRPHSAAGGRPPITRVHKVREQDT